MQVKIGSDGDKTCLVIITGQLSVNLLKPESILSFKNLKGSPKGLRLDGIQFSIQEKMGFNLWWTLSPEAEQLIMPLESRGGYDFEKIIAISSPPAAIGLALTSFKVTETKMSYLIMLDLTKQ